MEEGVDKIGDSAFNEKEKTVEVHRILFSASDWIDKL